MRALYQISKYPDGVASFPLDFNPWLESIGQTFVSATVTDAAGIAETYTVSGGVVNLKFEGGEGGLTYRTAVTATASNGETRTSVVEVSVIGLAPVDTGGTGGAVNVVDSLAGNSTTDAPSIRAVNAALAGASITGDIDGGLPDSTYTSTAIEGGGP